MKLDATNKFAGFLTPWRMPETEGSGTMWREAAVEGETQTANLG